MYDDHPECVPMHDWMVFGNGNGNGNGNGYKNGSTNGNRNTNENRNVNTLPLSTCNIVHEQPLYNFYNDQSAAGQLDSHSHDGYYKNWETDESNESNDNDENYGTFVNLQPKLLGHGSFRSAYRLANIYGNKSSNSSNGNVYEYMALKTLRDVDDGRHRPDSVFLTNHRIGKFQHDKDNCNLAFCLLTPFMTPDALFYERLSPSKFVVDIYGFCANGGLFEFAGRGSLGRTVREAYNAFDEQEEQGEDVDLDGMEEFQLKKLDMAIQVVRGVADMHTIESRNGHSAFVHCKYMIIYFACF